MKINFKYRALFKKLMFIFLMVLALSGLGMGAVFLPNQKREREQLNEVNIDMVAQPNDSEESNSVAEYKS